MIDVLGQSCTTSALCFPKNIVLGNGLHRRDRQHSHSSETHPGRCKKCLLCNFLGTGQTTSCGTNSLPTICPKKKKTLLRFERSYISSDPLLSDTPRHRSDWSFAPLGWREGEREREKTKLVTANRSGSKSKQEQGSPSPTEASHKKQHRSHSTV